MTHSCVLLIFFVTFLSLYMLKVARSTFLLHWTSTCIPSASPFTLLNTGTIGKFGRGLAAFAGAGGGRLFAQLAVLGGCDYVDNVRGLGLLSVLPIVARFKCIQADRRVSRILMHFQKMGKTVRVRRGTE